MSSGAVLMYVRFWFERLKVTGISGSVFMFVFVLLYYTILFLLLSFSSFPPIHSILVGTNISLFILYSSFLSVFNNPTILTPHVLSEWMVEV